MRLISTFFGKGLTLLVCLLMAGALQAQCTDAVNVNPELTDSDTNMEPDGYFPENSATFAYVNGEFQLTMGSLSQNISGAAVIDDIYTFTVDLQVLSGEADVSVEVFDAGFNNYIDGTTSGPITPADGATTVTVSTMTSNPDFAEIKIRVRNLTGTVEVTSACLTSMTPTDPVCEGNTLMNPTVDSDASGFNSFGFSGTGESGPVIAAGAGPDGTGALQVGPNSAGYYEVYQGVPAADGETWYAQVDARRMQPGTGFGQVRFYFDTGAPNFTRIGTIEFDVTSTDFETFNFSGTAPAGQGISEVRVAVSAGNNGVVIADNFCLSMTPPPGPELCPESVLTNGGFDSDLSSWGPYGSGVVHSADQGVLASGAADIDCVGGGCGLGQYGIAAAQGDVYEFTFSARTVDFDSYQNGLVRYRSADGSTMYGSASVGIRGPEFLTYRLVLEAEDAGVGTVDVQWDAGGSDRVIVDNVCLVPVTVEAVEEIPGNLIANGDFEDGMSPFNGGCCQNGEMTNDPSTGTGAFMFNKQNYSSYEVTGLPVREGDDYEIQLDAKVIGTISFAKANVSWFDAGGAMIGGREDNNLTRTGDFTQQSFTVTAPAGATTATIQIENTDDDGYIVIDNLAFIDVVSLPVTLTSFQGQAMDKYNKLSWVTATEENTEMFYVERSRNGVDSWVEIATANAFGNSSIERAYSINDDQPLSRGFYRVRSVDFDGAQQVSDVISIERNTAGELSVYPNPATDVLTVESKLEVASTYQLIDGIGRVLRTGTVQEGFQQTTVNIADLPRGRYIIRVGGESRMVIK